MHNEPWMQRQNIISDLNFRVSYGWQGNVAENYGPDLIARIGTGNDLIDWRTGEFMLKIQSLPYENLRWESAFIFTFVPSANTIAYSEPFGTMILFCNSSVSSSVLWG